MTTAKQFYEQPPLAVASPQKDWPTMYDLPSEYPVEAERQRREETERENERLRERLRALGIDPDQV